MIINKFWAQRIEHDQKPKKINRYRRFAAFDGIGGSKKKSNSKGWINLKQRVDPEKTAYRL